MSTSLTPERLAALRGFAENTARLPSGALVRIEPSELLALLDAADELGRVREALRVAEDALAKVSRHFEATDPDMREALDTVVTAALRMTRAALVGGKE